MDNFEKNNTGINVDEEDVRTGTQKAEKEKKMKRTLTIVGGIAIIIIIILLLLRGCAGSPANNPTKPNYGTEVDPNATVEDFDKMSEEEIIAALNEKVKEGMITISMATQGTFADGTSEGALKITNAEENRHPQVVEITLAEDGTMLYQSKLIPVGSNIKTGKLLVDLPKGEYPCIATFNSIDEDTGSLLGQARAEIKIIVEN